MPITTDIATTIENSAALLRLLQLASSTLPVGAYSYSQGLEWAVEEGLIINKDDTKQWIVTVLIHSISRLDAPVLARMFDGWANDNTDAVGYWNDYLLACRDTRELRDEDKHLGRALRKLLGDLGLPWPESQSDQQLSFAISFSFAAVQWNIPKTAMINGYLWSWLENQVLAAIKLVPLGQVAGQRILLDSAVLIPSLIQQAIKLTDEDIGGALPVLAIASSRHETQYTRLFRS